MWVTVEKKSTLQPKKVSDFITPTVSGSPKLGGIKRATEILTKVHIAPVVPDPQSRED